MEVANEEAFLLIVLVGPATVPEGAALLEAESWANAFEAHSASNEIGRSMLGAFFKHNTASDEKEQTQKNAKRIPAGLQPPTF